MVVFGTRPEGIKLAPVILAMREHPGLEPVVVNTVQHREMLDQVLGLFGIESDVELALQRSGTGLAELTSRLVETVTPVITDHAPDAVMVQGDTTTAFVAALAAFYEGVPVVHLEAGLRSGNPASPFPEEMNRRMVTRLASLHLAATPANAANLAAEGVTGPSVVVTGNTVIDALHEALRRPVPFTDPALTALDDDPRRVLLVTTHRRESWGGPMEDIGRAVADVARSEPDLVVVLPMHRNPLVRDSLLPHLAGLPNVVLTEPLPYGEFCRLMARAHVLLTDSGGVQEEGPSLGKPVLVMRENSERPEAITAGTARLVGTDPAEIACQVKRLLHDDEAYAEMANAVNPYGDGRAVPRVLAAIAHHLGDGPPAEPFTPAH